MDNEVMVEIKCENEGCVVGHIEVPGEPGKRGFLLASRVVWNGFKPLTEQYRLPKKMAGDGHVLRCPRCSGMLCVSGENETMKDETEDRKRAREEARERILREARTEGEVHEFIDARGIDPALVPITLGKTRIAAKR